MSYKKFLGILLAISPATASALELENYELVDLSHSYGESTLYWPTSPTPFEKEQLAYGISEERLVLLCVLGLHAGTWWNAHRCADALCGRRHFDRENPVGKPALRRLSSLTSATGRRRIAIIALPLKTSQHSKKNTARFQQGLSC